MSDHLNSPSQIWRQKQARDAAGGFRDLRARPRQRATTCRSSRCSTCSTSSSSPRRAKEPVAFDHDCREGICGTCGLVINGVPHGPRARAPPPASCTCAVQGRRRDLVEPWRAGRSRSSRTCGRPRAFDRIIAGRRLHLGEHRRAPDANAIPVPKETPTRDGRRPCIGCGACVAACPNASAMLFTAPRSRTSPAAPGPARARARVKAMVAQMDAEGFGNCTNHGECEAACPKEPRASSSPRTPRPSPTAPAELQRGASPRLPSAGSCPRRASPPRRVSARRPGRDGRA
jgi:succinate dehydrogenase / fumarate reductase iron-sulfur subunit